MDVSNAPALDDSGHPAPTDYRHPCAWDAPLAPLTVPGLLERAAREAPDSPAIDFLGRTYSYRQMWAEAHRVAALGRVPRAGETLALDGYRLTVDQVARRRVRRVTVKSEVSPSPEPAVTEPQP